VRGIETSYRGTTFSERMAAAPCAETDPDLSYPVGVSSNTPAHNQAKSICARCPLALREECLEVAMRTEGKAAATNRYGVFGGLDPEARYELAKARRAARDDVERIDEIIRNRRRGQEIAAAMETTQTNLEDAA
jgi:hypothetical protein